LLQLHSMTMHTDKIPNLTSDQTKKSLSTVLPEGLLVDRNWLKKKKFQRPLVDYYLRSGALEAVARGVYRRPGPPLKWQHAVYSLHELGFAVRVGGRSALDHQGLVHSLPMGAETIHLYSQGKLPGWLRTVKVNAEFETHHRTLFTENAATQDYNILAFGARDWPLSYSTRERALLEYLDDLPDGASFDMAGKYMESAATLRPELLMALLLACKRVKTKRLFLWLAERYAYPWFKQMDSSVLDLGSGKRVIYKGGVLNTKYNITVPKELDDLSIFIVNDEDNNYEQKEAMMTAMDSLVEKNRQQILSIAHENGVCNVRVFGSMARNEANEDSDLDLLVELEEGKTGLALGGFLSDVSELVHRKVDVVTEKSLHPRIREKVLHEARAL